MAQVIVIGAHPLDYSDELFDRAVTAGFGLVALSTDQNDRELAEFATREALRSVVLVELVVRNRDKTMYMGDFGQTSGDVIGPADPVAYGEVFLSEDGGHRVASFLDQVRSPDVRVAFYLHGFRPDQPLMTSYGRVLLPAMTEMPMRLKRLAPYELPRRE